MATSKAKRTVPLAQPKPQHSRRSPTQKPTPALNRSFAQIRGSGFRLRDSDARKAATELLPVKAHAYRAIAELNGGFEKVVRDLQTLGEISYFRSDRVTAMYDLICRVRAQANRDFIMALHDRETANAGHFERLCIQWEKAGSIGLGAPAMVPFSLTKGEQMVEYSAFLQARPVCAGGVFEN